VIFEINTYSGTDLPPWIKEDYPWIKNYPEKGEFSYCIIDSSTGMGGVVVIKNSL